MLFALLLPFLIGLLCGLLVQRLVRGSHGAWRTFLLVAIAIATPFACVFSLGGGLGGLHLMVIGALVPYLLLVGIPVLFRQSWKRFRRTPRQDV